jgi:geranylgeranyl diphosphate synthase type I
VKIASEVLEVDLVRALHESVAAALDGAPGSLDRFYGMMRYELGMVEANLTSPSRPTGIPLSAALCATCFKAVGGTGDAGTRAAAALACHAAWLHIHSDIEESRRMSKNRPALWTLEGAAQAINTGDGLFAIALSALIAAAPDGDMALTLSCRLTEVSLAYMNGRHLRLATAPSEMAGAAGRRARELMWGSLGGFGAWTGGLLGGAGEEARQNLRSFGFHMGMVVGLRDAAAQEEVAQHLHQALALLDQTGIPATEQEHLRRLGRSAAGER